MAEYRVQSHRALSTTLISHEPAYQADSFQHVTPYFLFLGCRQCILTPTLEVWATLSSSSLHFIIFTPGAKATNLKRGFPFHSESIVLQLSLASHSITVVQWPHPLPLFSFTLLKNPHQLRLLTPFFSYKRPFDAELL